MANRLFVPGTGGVTYRDTVTKLQVGSILNLAAKRYFELECEHPASQDDLAPLRTSAIRSPQGNAHPLVPDGIIRAVYTPFQSQQLPKYAFFEYDWRLDLRLNGQRLLDKLKTKKKWDIVCHSQGGLVAMAAALESRAVFKERVRRLIFMGVPMVGTLNAAAALIDGVDLIPGVRVPPPVVRTWPSIYQMLPCWNVGIPGVSGAELFKDSTWRAAGLLGAHNATATGLDPTLLARGRAWKRLITNEAFPALQEIEQFVIIQGKNHPTRKLLPEFPRLPSVGKINQTSIVEGDTLVPADLTRSMLSQTLRASLDGSFIVKGREHMFLCSEKPKLTLCEHIFSSR